MDVSRQFNPPRRTGLVFQLGLGALLVGASAFWLWRALQTEVGGQFSSSLLLSIVFFLPLPWLIYRIYGLARGRYVLERDGLRLRWGLRSEDIPLPEIEWVRPASEFPSLYVYNGKKPASIPLPYLRWPGALIGVRQVEGLGPVEFLAADESNLVLVATAHRIYAISPTDPKAFLRAFHRINELGSLAPLQPHSVYPSVLLARVWMDRLAQILIGAGLVLNLLLLLWVSLVIPSRATIPLGFTSSGTPGESGPVERLLLLPVLSALTYLIDLGIGLYLYPRSNRQPVAYLLWAGAALQAVLMLIAVFFLSRI